MPAPALALMEPQPLFDPFALQTTARVAPATAMSLTGVKALVPRAADAELFVIAAAARRTAARRCSSSRPGRPRACRPSPIPGWVSAPPRPQRLTLTEVAARPARRCSETASAEIYAECVALGRLAWCALAVGTGQAALEYVSDYVNNRSAFGEPISNRQAVAFTVANMAIELEGLRLATYRAAARRPRPAVRPRGALARRLAADKGMQIGSDAVQMLGGHGFTREHPVERGTATCAPPA